MKLYDFCRTKDGVNDLLDTVAKNFIRHEEGERRAESPYRDIPDDELTEEGYFLRHSDEKPDQIDVCVRKIQVAVGRVWNSYDVSCEKVMHFAVTEASLGLPIECTGKGVILQTFSTAKESQQQGDHLSALKERLVKQRARVDKQIIEEVDFQEVTVVSQESDTDEEELENPIVRLKRRIATEEYVQPPEPLIEFSSDETDVPNTSAGTCTPEYEDPSKVDEINQLINQLSTHPDEWSNKIDDAKNLIDNLSGDHGTPPPPPPPPPHLLTELVDNDYPSPVHLSTPQSVPSPPYSSLQHSPISARWGCPHENYDSDDFNVSDSDSSNLSDFDSSDLSDSSDFSYSYSDSDCENAQETE